MIEVQSYLYEIRVIKAVEIQLYMHEIKEKIYEVQVKMNKI